MSVNAENSLDPADFYYFSQFLLGIPLPQLESLNWDQSLSYVHLLQANLSQEDFAMLGKLMAQWSQLNGATAEQQASIFEKNVLNNPDQSLWKAAQKVIMLWYTGAWPGASVAALQNRDPKNYPNLLSWILAPDQHAMGVPKGQNYWNLPAAGVATENNQ